jgi:hypothetical protein
MHGSSPAWWRFSEHPPDLTKPHLTLHLRFDIEAPGTLAKAQNAAGPAGRYCHRVPCAAFDQRRPCLAIIVQRRLDLIPCRIGCGQRRFSIREPVPTNRIMI